MFDYWREIIVITLFIFIIFIPFVWVLFYTITSSISSGWNVGKIRLTQVENERMGLIVKFAENQKEKEKIDGEK